MANVRQLLLLALTLPFLGCTFDFQQWYRGNDASGSDAGQTFEDHRGLGAWSEPKPLFMPENRRDDDPTLTADGRFLVFECRRPAGQSICLTSRASAEGPFGPHEVLMTGQDIAALGETPETAYELATPAIYQEQLYFTVNEVDEPDSPIVYVTGFSQGELTSQPELAEQFRFLAKSLSNLTFARDGEIVMAQMNESALLELRFDGSTREEIPHPELAVEGLSQRGPMLSPDGLTLYYEQHGGGTSSLWMAARDEVMSAFDRMGPIVELDQDDAEELDAEVSPDGRRMVFVRRGAEAWFMVATRQ